MVLELLSSRWAEFTLSSAALGMRSGQECRQGCRQGCLTLVHFVGGFPGTGCRKRGDRRGPRCWPCSARFHPPGLWCRGVACVGVVSSLQVPAGSFRGQKHPPVNPGATLSPSSRGGYTSHAGQMQGGVWGWQGGDPQCPLRRPLWTQIPSFETHLDAAALAPRSSQHLRSLIPCPRGGSSCLGWKHKSGEGGGVPGDLSFSLPSLPHQSFFL